MKITIQQYLCHLFRVCLLVFFAFDMLLLGSCSDDTEMEIINSSRKNVISLSIPDAELVQVRSVANESECMISGIQVFVYNDTHTSSPVYYQEGKADLSFLFGNGTASPTVTLKKYIPSNGERIYVVCNLTDRSSASGEGDFLINKTVSEEQLRNYTGKGLMKGFSSVQSEGRTIPMYGWMEWNENATTNICLLTRCLAKVTVDAGADLFSGKQVYWEWRNLNYSDFTLDSEYKGGIYQGNINESGISEKHDLLSATTPFDETKGLVANYYPLEYGHSIYALGNKIDKKTFSKDRAMLLLVVQNPDGLNKEYYRLDFLDKETGQYLDIMRNHSYRFTIAKLKNKGYDTALEAIQNPGSNIEYTVTVSDNWSRGYASNGQYLVKTDRENLKLIENGITDPVTMVKFELQADNTGNVDFSGVTTRKVRILNSDKKTLISSSDLCLFYSIDNNNLVQVKGTGGLPVNEANLPQNSNVYWIYCTVPEGSSLKDGFLEISVGNIVKYIPFSIIPHTEAIAVDEDGPANSFITPVTYGVYSFDATVIGNGVEGIVEETRGKPDNRYGVLTEDIEKYHFKNGTGEDISVSKNVAISPKSAKLIWQDQENLISQVSFNSNTNRVEFLSNGAGNGVIAVYDNWDPNAEDANVLWSWHIWCTEKPDIIELGLPTNGESYSGKNYKIMDRDLGATTNIPDRLTTCGLGYQWGRKDPFVGLASFYTSMDDLQPEFASVYNVRGTKQELKEEMKNESIGTIEYGIKHPNIFIRSGERYSAYDWLYYTNENGGDDYYSGNQYLWGNNPYSRYKMINIETMKTLYDPCPAGYKVPPPDTYGAFLKKPIITDTIISNGGGHHILGYIGKMLEDSYYTPSYTEYGAYFYYGGENSARKVYFISAGTRVGREDDIMLILPGYNGHLSGTMTSYGISMNTVMTFWFSQFGNSFYCSFGGGIGFSEDRVSAAAIRCVRDE
ncbi:hypothetical protein [uncultured Bacteroides sp.]|uniref:hypothetical protein n=1 Tax=uncultured Bacteroides sp. TaxID=162156 RepID=UPI0025CD2AFE|nr:hypothetical protein [uncultured Bacteroides sp.]